MKLAKGTKGYLLQTLDGYVFRVYSNNEFIDYKINHPDLLITINDEDAVLYTNDYGENYIDQMPETLGLEEDK
jgi:hypothetical protein